MNLRHPKPLHYTGYIGSSQIDCIQIDPGCYEHLAEEILKVSGNSITTIFGYNASSGKYSRKNKLKC